MRGLLIGLVLLTPSIALAQPRDASPADALFERGLAAFESGRIDEACTNFEDSLRLDPAQGTLINLARCHERQGKTSAALAEYRQVAVLSARAGNQDRARVARSEAERLEALIAASPPPAASAVSPPRSATSDAAPASAEAAPAPASADDGLRPLTITGITLGTIGAASLISGAVLGAISLSDLSTAEDDPSLCPGQVCSPAGRAWVDAAETRGNAATGLLVVGGVLAAAGVVLVSVDLGTHDDDAAAPRLAVTPAIGPGNTGLRASFQW